MSHVEQSEVAGDLAALVRYGCYQRVWQFVRSCRKMATTPERKMAYLRMEQAVLDFMDEEWPRLAVMTDERGLPIADGPVS